MGLAVYNSTILDIRFPLCCYKKLLNPAVVPTDRNATVGVTKLHLSDLKEVMPVSNAFQLRNAFYGWLSCTLCRVLIVRCAFLQTAINSTRVEYSSCIFFS